ncbi:MAG TPA: iron-containing redox enzyme family protein [Terriglobales bacterium]|jgi:pyrroloquinoline-quinone synthase
MTTQEFFQQLDERIAKYDLLCHPFYKAWSAGQLTRDDLREYAEDYFHHVEAFPAYLGEFAERLEDGKLRRAVVANMKDEMGNSGETGERAHSELWLDFVEGMDGSRELGDHKPVAEIKNLIAQFKKVASEGCSEEVLAAFYAYESQIPRVAQEKARGLHEMYGADKKTCGYFTLHATADVFHSQVWKGQLAKSVEEDSANAEKALKAGEAAAKALWSALDGIETRRLARAA